MKKNHFSKGLLFGLLAILVSACTNPYQKSIPKDAFVVAEVDVKSLALKSDVLSQEQKINDLIELLAQEMEVDNEISVKDLGLDFLRPMYVFATLDDGYFLAAVRNQKKLHSTLLSLPDMFELQIVEADGLSWVKVGSQTIGAITSNALLLGTSSSKADYRDMLENNSGETYFDTDAGKLLKKKRGDITISLDMTTCPTFIQEELYDEIEYELGDLEDLGLEDLFDDLFETKLALNLQCEAGKIACNLYGESMAEINQVMSQKISADDLKLVPHEDLICLGALSIDGKKILKYAEEIMDALSEDMSSYERDAMDAVERFLNNVNGTAVAAAVGKTVDKDPNLLCVVPTQKASLKSFLRDMDEDLPSYLTVIEQGSQTVLTEIPNYSIQSVASNSFKYASHAKSCYLYSYVNMKPVVKYWYDDEVYYASSREKKVINKVYDAFSLLDYSEFKVEADGNTSVAVYLNDDSKNALAFVLDHALSLAIIAMETYN